MSKKQKTNITLGALCATPTALFRFFDAHYSWVGSDWTLNIKKGRGLAGETLTLQRSVAKNRPHTVHIKRHTVTRWELTVDCAFNPKKEECAATLKSH